MSSAISAVKPLMRAARPSSTVGSSGSVAAILPVICTDWRMSPPCCASITTNAVITKPRNATVSTPPTMRFSVLFSFIGPLSFPIH